MTLQCASIAPLGRPVVPDVYRIMAVSSSPTAAGGCTAALSVRPENCDAFVVLDGNPVRQIGSIAALGQPISQRSLVDQKPCAAIGEHIGDFRLLLPGAEYDRHGAEMRRAEHREYEFDAVAEQQRDAVAALQA